MSERDELAEHMGKLGNPHGWWSSKVSMADAIRANPQAHIDALVAAGVLESVQVPQHYRWAPGYRVVEPPHVHDWRAGGSVMDPILRLACRGCESICDVPNKLPIEVPQ